MTGRETRRKEACRQQIWPGKAAWRILSKRTLSAFLFALLVTVLACALYPAGILSADLFLVVRQTPVPSDIIVVLGGDGAPRATRAAQLWHQGVAPRVLAVGIDDCRFIKARMIEASVPPSAFVEECTSTTTWDNARLSAPILTMLDVHSAILVTSWFHSGRALKSFAMRMPSIRWTSVPAERSKPYWLLMLDYDGVQIFKEYPKTWFYDLRAVLGFDITKSLEHDVKPVGVVR